MIDFANLEKMVAEKYVSVQKHPTEELYIYNYTQRAQFDRVWNNETMQCRGLILNGKREVVARPFPKFFNLEEAVANGEQLPLENFQITEKFDGSLGILYWVNDIPYLATRGSFVSDQAVKGTELLQRHAAYFDELNRDYTYLFEIIYPENRIVVDYNGMEDLVLLAVVETASGEELDVYEYCADFSFAGHKRGITDYTKLKELQEANKEGFVIRFANGKRYKVKFDEYVRLHRLVTGVNARTIWDLLLNGQSFDELLDRVPDEFFSWVKRTRENLQYEFDIIETLALKEFDKVKILPTRKEQALAIQDFKYKSIVFALLDKKPYHILIWKLLKPKHEVPFKEEL